MSKCINVEVSRCPDASTNNSCDVSKLFFLYVAAFGHEGLKWEAARMSHLLQPLPQRGWVSSKTVNKSCEQHYSNTSATTAPTTRKKGAGLLTLLDPRVRTYSQVTDQSAVASAAHSETRLVRRRARYGPPYGRSLGSIYYSVSKSTA